MELEFLDHVEDGSEPLRFLVWGMLIGQSKKHYEIISWAYADIPPSNGADHNEKRWTIVKSAVERIQILK